MFSFTLLHHFNLTYSVVSIRFITSMILFIICRPPKVQKCTMLQWLPEVMLKNMEEKATKKLKCILSPTVV